MYLDYWLSLGASQLYCAQGKCPPAASDPAQISLQAQGSGEPHHRGRSWVFSVGKEDLRSEAGSRRSALLCLPKHRELNLQIRGCWNVTGFQPPACLSLSFLRLSLHVLLTWDGPASPLRHHPTLEQLSVRMSLGRGSLRWHRTAPGCQCHRCVHPRVLGRPGGLGREGRISRQEFRIQP